MCTSRQNSVYTKFQATLKASCFAVAKVQMRQQNHASKSMTLRERASMDPTVKVVCVRVLNGALMNRDTPCVDKRVEVATHEFSSASRMCRHSVSVHCNFALPRSTPMLLNHVFGPDCTPVDYFCKSCSRPLRTPVWIALCRPFCRPLCGRLL